MSRSTTKGMFTPQYPKKYIGEYPIVFRSTWELEFMHYCDKHPDVMEWASEPVKIPYKNPLASGNKTQSIYIPDFLVTYVKKGGGKSTKLIEIKPMHEAMESYSRNTEDAKVRIKNEAKWGAATQWAGRRGIDFLVLTEQQLYSNHANRKGRMHPIKGVGKEVVKKVTPKSSRKSGAKKTANNTSKVKFSRSKSKISRIGRSRRVPKARKAPRR